MYPFCCLFTITRIKVFHKCKLLMSHSLNHPTGRIIPRTVCWTVIAKTCNKCRTWKEWPRCWSQKLAAWFLSQTEMFLRLPVRQTNVFLSGTGNKNITRQRSLYTNLERFLSEEVAFTTIYRVYKYFHHCPEERLNQAVSPTLMLSNVCDSSVFEDTH